MYHYVFLGEELCAILQYDTNKGVKKKFINEGGNEKMTIY
jgi:hypothetical protein